MGSGSVAQWLAALKVATAGKQALLVSRGSRGRLPGVSPSGLRCAEDAEALWESKCLLLVARKVEIIGIRGSTAGIKA